MKKVEHEVMNNNDLRKKIWSYLRKEPLVRCIDCKRVCVWDNKILVTIYNLDPYDIDNKDYRCKDCYTEESEPEYECRIS